MKDLNLTQLILFRFGRRWSRKPLKGKQKCYRLYTYSSIADRSPCFGQPFSKCNALITCSDLPCWARTLKLKVIGPLLLRLLQGWNGSMCIRLQATPHSYTKDYLLVALRRRVATYIRDCRSSKDSDNQLYKPSVLSCHVSTAWSSDHTHSGIKQCCRYVRIPMFDQKSSIGGKTATSLLDWLPKPGQQHVVMRITRPNSLATGPYDTEAPPLLISLSPSFTDCPF